MFELKFETDNAAFADDPDTEIARILHDVADRVGPWGPGEQNIRDLNGNTIGYSLWVESEG